MIATTTGTATGTAASTDLEASVFNAIPGLVAKAMGPARKWFGGALEWVCGDPEKLTKTGELYLSLGQDVSALSVELQQMVDGVPSWQGPAAHEFRETMGTTVDVVNKVGNFVGTTNEILTAAAEIAVEAANMIWDLVVELVGWLVKSLAVALASSTISFGATIAAWLGNAVGSVAKAVTSVFKVVKQVAGFLQKIWTLIKKVMAIIQKYKAVLEKVKAILQRIKELSTKAGAVGGSTPTWEDFKKTHDSMATGSSISLGPDPSTLVDPTPWVPKGDTGGNVKVPAGFGDYEYTPGFVREAGTGAAGVNDGGAYTGGVNGGGYNGSGYNPSVGGGNGSSSINVPTGTAAASVSGGFGGVGGGAGSGVGGGAPLLTGGVPGGAGRSGTGAAGVGGMGGGAMGMMPMTPGGGVGPSSSSRAGQSLGKGETPLAAPGSSGGTAGGTGAHAPMMGGGLSKKEQKKAEGRGVLATARLGEEHDEQTAAAKAAQEDRG